MIKCLNYDYILLLYFRNPSTTHNTYEPKLAQSNQAALRNKYSATLRSKRFSSMWGIKVDTGSHSHDAVGVQAWMRRKVVILDVGQVDAVANTRVLIDVASVLLRQPTELRQNDSNMNSDDGQSQEICSDRGTIIFSGKSDQTRVHAQVLLYTTHNHG